MIIGLEKLRLIISNLFREDRDVEAHHRNNDPPTTFCRKQKNALTDMSYLKCDDPPP